MTNITMVPCPRCGAQPGVMCTTPSGTVRHDHVDRSKLDDATFEASTTPTGAANLPPAAPADPNTCSHRFPDAFGTLEWCSQCGALRHHMPYPTSPRWELPSATHERPARRKRGSR